MNQSPKPVLDPQQEIQHVSDTAFWIAYLRGLETGRSDALFQDPLAAKLAGERGRRITESIPQSRITGWIVAMRTLIIDDCIRHAVLHNGVDTILNLGAGLDTRPYWLQGLPSSTSTSSPFSSALRWIEVDYPEMIALKENELADQPRPQAMMLERVGLDLANTEARQEFFASVSETSKKVFVLTEGVVPYLSNEQAAALAQDLRRYPNFAYWMLDYVSPQALIHRRRQEINKKLVNSPFLFAPPDWYQFFADEGWKEKETRYYWDLGRKVGRSMPLPLAFKIFMGLRSFFLSKEMKEAWRKSAGYVLLERS